MKIFYIVVNNGDGSAGVEFYESQELADIALKIDEDTGEQFCDAEVCVLDTDNMKDMVTAKEYLDRIERDGIYFGYVTMTEDEVQVLKDKVNTLVV